MTVNGAIVSEVDKEASNGVIHVIEDVLLIIAKVPMGSGLETKAAQRDFSTLKTAVEAADLKETLDGMIIILNLFNDHWFYLIDLQTATGYLGTMTILGVIISNCSF